MKQLSQSRTAAVVALSSALLFPSKGETSQASSRSLPPSPPPLAEKTLATHSSSATPILLSHEQMSHLAKLVAKELTAREPSSPTNATVLSEQWVSGHTKKLESTVYEKTGWHFRTIASLGSLGILSYMFASRVFGKKFPFEFSVSLTDLRQLPSGDEVYKSLRLFGRTEIDVLFGKSKDISSRLFSIFMPSAWSFVKGQNRARATPEFPVVRIKDRPALLDNLENHLMVNTANHAVLKQSNRDGDAHLRQEITRLDGAANLDKLHPPALGEDAVAVMTYEHLDNKINRVLVISSKDLCTFLANPCRYLDGALRAYLNNHPSPSKERLDLSLIKLNRELGIALAILETDKDQIGSFVKEYFPRTWEQIQKNAALLRPLLTLPPRESRLYLLRCCVELEKTNAVSPLSPEKREQLHALKKHLIEDYSKTAHPGGGLRELGMLSAEEEKKIQDFWFAPPEITARIGAFAITTKRWFSEINQFRIPRNIEIEKPERKLYDWFRVLSAADPAL